MKHLLSFAIILFGLSSCKIVYSTTFNSDNGGETSIYIDMTEFSEKMGKDVSKKTEEKLGFDSKKNKNLDSLTMVEYVNQINGITNVTSFLNEDEFTYGLDLTFDSPLSLNLAMNRIQHYITTGKDSTAVLKNFEYYQFTDNFLKLKQPLKAKSDSKKDQKSNEKLNKMAEMISMQWVVTFTKRKIKKVNSKFKITKNGKKQIVLKIDANELENRESETIATINLK